MISHSKVRGFRLKAINLECKMKIKIATYGRYKVYFFVFLVLIVSSIILYKQEVSVISKGSNIATIISAAISFLGIFGIIYQLDKQGKKEKIELILKLSADFYNNDKHMGIFEIIDKDENDPLEVEKRENELKRLIEGHPVNKEIKEIHLNAYLNFFNSLAVLVEEGVVDKNTIRNIFNYQLKKTFASNNLKEYMTNYEFKKVLKYFENLD
jgi:uncharacterized membrane protein